MKTKNAFREAKKNEVHELWMQYDGLTEEERTFMVVDTLDKRAIRTEDPTKRASLAEFAGGVWAILIDRKTRKPTTDALNLARRLLTRLRKDKGHPYIRPYTQPVVERLVDGTEVVRYYIAILRGKAAIVRVNTMLTTQITGLKNSIAANNSLANTKRVDKERETYAEQLVAKQQEFNRKKKQREDEDR